MSAPGPVDEIMPAVERTYRALVHLIFAEADRRGEITRLDAATGFLVRLAGREFVFTAKHNLEGETPRSTGLGFPRELTVGVQIGIGVRGFLRGASEVDVAIVELDPAHQVLWRSAQPFEAHELGAVAEARSARALCLCGFPVAEVRRKPGVPGFQELHEVLATMQLVDEVPGYRSAQEPPEGRGIHVRYGGQAYDHRLGAWRDVSAPHGISGGPLIAIASDAAVRVLGCARSIENGVEWCEPVSEWLRLLSEHEDAQVAIAARRALEPV